MTIAEQVAVLRRTAVMLREASRCTGLRWLVGVVSEIDQAADTIERQAAEIETHLTTIHDMIARGTRRILEQGR